MVLPVGLSSLPEVRCSYLWHPYGLCLTQHSAFLAIVHSSLKPQNDSEAARIPQWQQAMSEELPVLQKTSFITLSDREGFKPLPDGNTTIEGNSDLVSILRRQDFCPTGKGDFCTGSDCSCHGEKVAFGPVRCGECFSERKTTWGGLHATFARVISFLTSS